MEARKAIITAEFAPAAVTNLCDMGYQVFETGWGQTRRELSEDALAALMPGASLLVVEVEQVTAKVIAAGPNLRAIATCRAKPVNIDMAAANAARIPVLTTPARNADSVADFALGALLALCRGISAGERHLRQDGWQVNGELPYFYFRGPEIAGKTLGLVGCGAIGRALIRRVQGFDLHILVFDPYIDQAALDGPARLATLEEVLTESDFISLHAPATAETRGMLDAARLALCKPTTYLVNTARAGIVDEDALYTALEDGRLAGAALDVFWAEPHIAPRWFTLSNVILTPHLAGAADDVKIHHSAMIIQDLRALRAGQVPSRLVNPQILV